MSWRPKILITLLGMTICPPLASADTDFVITLERDRDPVPDTSESFVPPVTQSDVLVTGEPAFTEPPTGIVLGFLGGWLGENSNRR
jgi:hypothetical protein